MINYFTNTTALTLARTYSTSLSSSTLVTLSSGTSYIEVSAIDKGIFMKWGAIVTSSNFDGFISQNSSVIYIVPSGTTTVQFIQESATAKLVVIEK